MSAKFETLKNKNLAGLACLLISILMLSGPVYAQFQGAEYCQLCHAEKYSDWSASGHPYMLMRGEDAQHRSIPLPTGYTWDDIDWVIGGFGRKVLYIDDDGYIITSAGGPGNNQFNLLTGNWTDYHPGEANKPYDCGACHTTNYVETGNQGGLPGMIGTFDAGGVQCEECQVRYGES